jgi:hypothetical protein
MNKDVEVLLREGLDQLAEGVRVPAGLAGRVLARRRRRRVAGYATAMAAAVTAVVAVAATGGLAGPLGAARTRPAAGPSVTRPALTTAYVVRRAENALANDDQVMRETGAAAPNSGGAGFFDGQLIHQSVTWAYQGRFSTDFLGAHGRVLAALGTGIVRGTLQGVQVDYIRHGWELQPGMLSRAPANACTLTGFLNATDDLDTNWPVLIGQTLACGGYQMAGYAEIDGTETVKLTGSQVLVIPTGPGSADHIALTDMLFISPATYLPLRITQSATKGRWHASQYSLGIQWLSPTVANRARASVTVPCGYRQIAWPSGDLTSGPSSSACG